MNVIQAVRLYITKMTDESGPGMKVLLMDKQTISIVSMAYSQSEIVQKEVYLFERIETLNSSEPMKHLKCIVFVRPTKENVELLCRELKNPRYGIYYIYFSNIIPKSDVKLLAESDELEVVREVQEFYGDYLAVSPSLFSLNVIGCSHGKNWEPQHLDRCVQGVTGLLLSLKLNPHIRYQSSSKLCEILADKVHKVIMKEELFRQVSHSHHENLLLILDRQDDPITPLLTQWTYQAMVHELLTIANNRVNLSHVPGISKEVSEVVLSAEQDEFYAENMYKNYGEIGQTIKELMDDFQRKAKNTQKIESISDMKHFIDNYPSFKKMSGTVAKHVTIVGELSSLLGERHLLEVSELEQELACQYQHSQQLQRVRSLIADKKIRNEEACKLVMIYGLRYRKHANYDLQSLMNVLEHRNVPESMRKMILRVLSYALPNNKSCNSNIVSQESVVKITKRFFKDLKGVENLYTQHVPVLKETLEEVIRSRLKETSYPYLPPRSSNEIMRSPQSIVVFMVGGVTYEEALCVHQLNKTCASAGIKIILGGSHIHNTQSFFDEVSADTHGMTTPNVKMYSKR